MLTDQIAQVHRSPGFITSNLVGVSDDGSTLIKEFEASHGTVTDLWNDHLAGKETSLNPLGLVEALLGAMTHAAQLEADAKPKEKKVQEMKAFVDNYAKTLREALHNTFRYGQGTRDMCGPTGFTTEDFIAKVAWRLDRYLVKQEHEKEAPPELAEEDLAIPAGKMADFDQKAILKLFEKYDKTGEGKIDFKNFSKMLMKMGVAPTKNNYGALRIPPLISKPLPLFSRLQNLKTAHKCVINTHHCPRVIKLAAIVWRRKQRYQLPPCEELVAILHNLMGTADEIQIMPIQELRHNIFPEREGNTAVILPPPVNILIGITPKQIAQQARVRDVRRSNDALDLVETRQLRTQPPMRAKDLLVNDRRAGEAVEAIRERLPELDPKPALALVVESVNAVDGRALVIPPQHEEILGVLNLIRQQETDGLEALLAAVDVVPQEDVVRLGGEASVFEQSEKIVVLAVHVAADLDGGLELQQHGLGDEQVARPKAEHFDLGFGEVDLLAGAGAADTEQLVDDDVHWVG
eukprot:CCRYP_012225-RA/>CCRYP_012225-RA protein AED:0.31 eAED:0.58 QI:0/0/0/1/0/0/2/0/519